MSPNPNDASTNGQKADEEKLVMPFPPCEQRPMTDEIRKHPAKSASPNNDPNKAWCASHTTAYQGSDMSASYAFIIHFGASTKGLVMSPILFFGHQGFRHLK